MAPRCATLDLVVVVFLAVTGRGPLSTQTPIVAATGVSLFCRVVLTYQRAFARLRR